MLSNDPSYTLNLPEVAQYSISLAHNIHLQSDWYNSIVKGNTGQTMKSKGEEHSDCGSMRIFLIWGIVDLEDILMVVTCQNG